MVYPDLEPGDGVPEWVADMTKEEAIKVLEDGDWWHFFEIPYDDPCHDEFFEAFNMALSAFRALLEAGKNEPLTLEEMRKMDGEPVYVVPQNGGYVAGVTGWAKVNARNERCEAPNLNFYFCEYVTYWLAYGHPPEEE